jgi:hypothetical protein
MSIRLLFHRQLRAICRHARHIYCGPQISIQSARGVRAGWEKHFATMVAAGDDRLVDGVQPAATGWDQEEWEWGKCP